MTPGSWGAQNNDPGLAGGGQTEPGQVGKRIRGQPGVPHELPAGWEEEEKVEEKREEGRGRPAHTHSWDSELLL